MLNLPKKMSKRSREISNVISRDESRVGLIVEKKMLALKILKYVDTNILAQNSSVTVGVQDLVSGISQGVNQGQRTGDTVRLQRMEFRYNITSANADVFNMVRFVFFVWKPNTGNLVPTGAIIFSSTTTQGIYSPFNFEQRREYDVLLEINSNMTGVAASPCDNSQYYQSRSLNLNGRKVQFNLAVTTGTGHIYFTNYSDSAAIPFPVYNLVTRIWYYDD
jgi:hypothetical protein